MKKWLRVIFLLNFIFCLSLTGCFIFLHDDVIPNREKENNPPRYPGFAPKKPVDLFEPIQYDEKLTNVLFSKSDSIKDSVYIDSGLPYFNMPINSNCFTSGDFGDDTLVFCEGERKNDTLFVELTNPTVCCFYNLKIKIVDGKFSTNLVCSYDVSPANAFFVPVKQKLIIKEVSTKSIDMLEGYILFEGKGKYLEDLHSKLAEKDKQETFSQNVEGYFKCRIK